MNRLSRNTIVMFVLDLLLAVSASGIAILYVRFYFSAVPDFFRYFALYVGSSAGMSAAALLLSKTHRIVFQYATFKAVLNLLVFSTLKITLLAIPYFFNLDFIFPHSGLLLICDYSVTLLFLILEKAVLFLIPERERSEDEEKSVSKLNVVIYGTDFKSVAVVTRYHTSARYNVKGFITREKDLNGKIIMDLPVYYLPEDLRGFHLKDIEAVLFSRYEDMQADVDLISHCKDKGICLLAIPSTDNTNYPGLEVQEIKHMLENNFIPDNMSGIERASKRLIDLSFSTVLIILFSPIMLIIAIVIRIKDGSPVLFKQERIGRFGRPFNILKFRTMRLDAEASGPALYSGKDDPRMTELGKFLRQHHLDEMPQLFNVFFGEMSFVGYRPERKVFIDKIVEKDARYAYLYQIRPGVTSYATLKNGYTDTLEKMLRRLKYDLYYLNHRSLLFDIKILWHTFLSIAIGKKF